MTTPEQEQPQPRDIAVEMATPELAEQLEAASAPEDQDGEESTGAES